jgi:carboxymethylenebutenolidase
MGETIELTTRDGARIGAYRARPSGQPRAGLVVIQEVFGVNRHIRNVADRFAAEGYLAVAPALFDRVERHVELGYDGSASPKIMELRGRLTLDNSIADVTAAVKAATPAGKIGIVGYCWGGLLAYIAASRIPGIAAAVGYYGGGIVNHLDDAPKVPLMLHFGERDAHIPLSEVDEIHAAHRQVPIYTYPADHGFNCDERASYDATSAKLALERTLKFFAEHLAA